MSNTPHIEVKIDPGTPAAPVQAGLERLLDNRFAGRLWARDAMLFGADQERQKVVANRLGWLDAPAWLALHQTELEDFARAVKADGFRYVVLLGMGGSSLCPEVLASLFGVPAGLKRFLILDSTDPEAVRRIQAEIVPTETLFIVASKSGTTTETRSQAAYFFDLISTQTAAAGEHFIAITDTGSALEEWAVRSQFRRVFVNPADIGGRYSALSYFGMVPAALLGIPFTAQRTEIEALAAQLQADDQANPGLQLGALMAEAARAGQDKLTFLTTGPAAKVVPWIEQLIAESTGKEGKGIVPIEGEPEGATESYGDDRSFCRLRIVLDTPADQSAVLDTSASQPSADVEIPNLMSLGATFLLWEFAVSAAGWLLGINPYDEPNVKESKDNTGLLLRRFHESGNFGEQAAPVRHDHFEITPGNVEGADAEALLAGFTRDLGPSEYLSLLYFGDQNDAVEEWLNDLRARTRNQVQVATLRGYGPRYLHSIGQLYKGGRQNGRFIIFTVGTGSDLDVPGERFGFGTLIQAQALGDFQALTGRGRPVLHVHLKGDRIAARQAFTELWSAGATVTP